MDLKDTFVYCPRLILVPRRPLELAYTPFAVVLALEISDSIDIRPPTTYNYVIDSRPHTHTHTHIASSAIDFTFVLLSGVRFHNGASLLH
jgi:hypothetical protein